MQTRLPIFHETLLSYDIKTREILAINEEAYTSLSNYLSKEDVIKTAQPNLIVGESGCGKTFLMKRLYGRIKENMSNILYPIVIEGKSLFSTDDIWSQCASRLEINHEKSAFDAVWEWQKINSKRVVLFVDNMQYYFERTDNTEQYGLRGKLNKSGAPILIATVEKVLPAFTEYDAAFFDGFKITYLKPLTVSTVEKITNGRYEINRLEKIMAYMPKTVRSMFNATSTQTQRILSALSQSESGLTLSEIREITGQENGKISPYLKLMIDQKLVYKEAKSL